MKKPYTAVFSDSKRTKSSHLFDNLYKSVKTYLMKHKSAVATLSVEGLEVVKLHVIRGKVVDIAESYPNQIQVNINGSLISFNKIDWPYGCTDKDRFPNAHIFSGAKGWLGSYSLAKNKDGTYSHMM